VPEHTGRFTDIGPEDFAARLAQGFGSRDTGDPLGRLVEKCHPPVQVHRENAVGYAVQDDFGLGW
jgi:hypothetical protein